MFRLIGMLGCVVVSMTYAAAESADANVRIIKNEFFEAAEAYLASHEPWKGADVSISRGYVKELEVPSAAEVTMEVKELKCSKPWGKLAVPVSVVQKSGGRTIKRRVQTYLEVDMRTTVAVAVRNIRHHEPLTENNVKFIRMALSSAPRNAVIHKESVRNARAVGAIMAGKIVTTGVVEGIPDVKKGQRVSLVAVRGGIRVATAGIARQDGRIGGKIRVMNEKSERIVTGTVRNGGVVEIAH